MSSPSDGACSASTHHDGKKKRPDLSKPKSSRPGSSRHGSSFLDRLHRKHDAKHHPEQAPLLADPEPQETPEPEAQSQPRRGYGDIWNKVVAVASHASAVVTVAKKFADAFIDAGNAIGRGGKTAARKTGQHVNRNQKRYMGGAIALLTASTTGLGVSYATSNPDLGSSSCTTPSCVQAADTILRNMHPDVAAQAAAENLVGINSFPIDPCESFDQFVCGGFDQQHRFRSDQNEIYTGTLMADEVDAILKHILEQDDSKVAEVDKHIFKLAKDDYKSCMDEPNLLGLGLDPLKEVIDDLKAHMPTTRRVSRNRDYHLQFSMAGDEPRGDFLTDLMVDTILLGAPALVAFRVGADDKAPDHQVLFVSPVHAIGLPTPELYYNEPNPDILVDYTKACNDSLKNFYHTPKNVTAIWHGGLKSNSHSKALADNVVDFESKLAKIVPSREQEQNITQTYNKMALDDFNKMLPQIDLQMLYSGVAHTTPAPKTVIVSSPKYLQRLSNLLQETDKATLQAFFTWKVVQAWASRIEDYKLSTLKVFNANLRGTKTDQPEERWRKCVHSVNADLGWITSRFYVNDGTDLSRENSAQQLIGGIKAAFTNILTASTWMSPDDRETAANKARGIEAKIGYPTAKPNVKDANSVEEYYRFYNLEISDLSYFTNGVKATRQQVRRQWARAAGSSTNKDEWEMYSTTVNAYYNPATNRIFVPAAMLQSPILYEKSLPSYVNYGSLGSIAGHEISHAFDPVGSHYDVDGTYDDWWSDETAAKFSDKAQCFVDQYSSYKVPGPKGDLEVNGNLTLAEAIADAGGAHAAFKAWQEREEKSKSSLLPGLDKFTREQVFWLSYGNFWCSKMTPERALQVVLADPHAPKSIRILGTVANAKGFREAWDCPSKEPTCDLW